MNECRTYSLPLPMPGTSVEEVREMYRQHYGQHGNDLDLLTQSMMFIQAGLYREAAEMASQVMPSDRRDEVQGIVDKGAAQTAYLAAYRRARPLYEQAAMEIEGVAEGSHTMASYEMVAEMLEADDYW